jgi:FkbH-like protein
MSLGTTPWLVNATPSEKSALAESLAGRESLDFHELRRLSAYDFGMTGLRRVGRSVLAYLEKFPEGEKIAEAGLVLQRALVLSTATFSHMSEMLVGAGLRHGVVVVPTIVEYEDALAWSHRSSVASKFDVAIVCQNSRSLRNSQSYGSFDAEKEFVGERLQETKLLVNRLQDDFASKVLLQTLEEDQSVPSSLLDVGLANTHRRLVRNYNDGLGFIAAELGILVYDLASVASMIGIKQWWPGRYLHSAKLPFSMECVPLYLDGVTKLIALSCGKSKRVLVLDLDNTLWGGVVGDDGLEGLKLGQGDALGEAHLAIQRYVLELKNKGILLCVSSKNNHELAIEVFRSHPDMLLKETDITSFQINWGDKSKSLEIVASELQIGLESFVFIDDNPVERKLVRDRLPMVAVPELSADPSDWPVILNSAAYFEQSTLTTEDINRHKFYAGEQKRRQVAADSKGGPDFLRSLQMELQVSSFDPVSMKRIAQLVAKSNQFNLTTLRYSEAELIRLNLDPMCVCFQARLSDIFGDNGMISVMVAKQKESIMDIDLWVMSCRVIGRSVEDALLNLLVSEAKKRGVNAIRGKFLATARNQIVSDLYQRLGFSNTDSSVENWLLSVDDYLTPELPFHTIIKI